MLYTKSVDKIFPQRRQTDETNKNKLVLSWFLRIINTYYMRPEIRAVHGPRACYDLTEHFHVEPNPLGDLKSNNVSQKPWESFRS